MLSAPVALAAFAVAGIAVGVVTAGRTRALGVALALTTLALPLLVEPLYARVLLAFGCMVFVVRAIDLARDSRQWPTVDRVWLMFAVFDVREADSPFGDGRGPKSTDKLIENETYRVTLNDAGDIAQIHDKINKRDLLAKPAESP